MTTPSESLSKRQKKKIFKKSEGQSPGDEEWGEVPPQPGYKLLQVGYRGK